jgi:TIR domain
MADIFLSYNEKDRDAVMRLAEVLQQQGWSVWWDRRIPAGQTWRSVLEGELQSMRCMVVLWSANSVRSEWVCEEAAEARQLGRLVPVAIDKVRPPAGFREVQAADLVGWDGSREHLGLRQLIEDITRLIGKPTVLTQTQEGDDAAPTTSPPADPPKRIPGLLPSPPVRWLPWVIAAMFALLAGGAYFATRPPDMKDGVAAAQPASLATVAAVPPPTNKTASAEKAKVKTLPPRCSALRERQSLGEALSAEAQQFLRKEC